MDSGKAKNSQQENSHPERHSGDSAAVKSRPPTRRLRRVRRLAVFFLLLVIVLIWLSPYLASTSVGLGLIVSAVNGRMDEQIEIAKLSLSWLGPCQATDITVRDAVGRDIFHLTKVTSAKGLWQGVISPQNFEQLTLHAPRAVVYLSDQEGHETGSSITPTAAKRADQSSRILPVPTGRLIVRAGGVRMVQPDGRTYGISQFNGQFDFNTLNDIKGELQLELSDGGKIGGQININQLFSDNQINLEKATGTFHLATEGEVELGPLLEFFQSRTTAGGKAQGEIVATFKSGQVQAELSTQLTGLHVERQGTVEIQPIDIKFEGNVQSDAKAIKGRGNITSQAGNIDIKFTYRPSEEPISVSSDDFVKTVLTGKTIKLPEIFIETDGYLDLPVLAAAVPSLLKIRPDLQIIKGELKIDKVSIHSGVTNSAIGAVHLTNLVAKRGGQTIVSEPISADFDIYLEPGIGLRIRHVSVNSAFAQMSASGTASKLKGHFAVDLNKLHQQIDDFLELELFELEGIINGTLDVDRSDKDRVNVDLEMIGKGISYRIEGRELNVQDLEVIYKGYLSMNEQGLDRLVATRANANLDNQVVVNGSGWYDLQKKTFHSELALEQGDLAYITRQTAATGGVDLSQYARGINYKVSFDYPEDNQKIFSRGQGVLYDISGQQGSQMKITHDIEVDPQSETIVVKQAQINSQMLSGQITGQIKEYKSLCNLALKGWYEGSWEQITTLIHNIAPETQETFQLAGTSRSKFEIVGPLRQPHILPAYHGVNAGLDVNWTAGNVYGLTLGQGVFSPTLKDGQIKFSDTIISAGGGKINLVGFIVDLRGQEPMLVIPGKVQLLQDVQINPILGRELLSRINPIFANMADIEGKVSLLLEDVSVPLSENIKQSGNGKGRLDLSQMKFQPRGILAELMRLGGQRIGPAQSINDQVVNFAIAQGRINYDNFVVNFAEDFEVNFHGSVGFDDTIDLVASVPIGASLLKRFGARGPVAEYARLLAGSRVDIPMIGTRLNPKLDFAKVNIQPLIERALEDLLKERARKVLDDIFKRPKTKQPDSSSDKTPKPKSPQRDVLDILFDVIEQQSQTTEKDKNHE